MEHYYSDRPEAVLQALKFAARIVENSPPLIGCNVTVVGNKVLYSDGTAAYCVTFETRNFMDARREAMAAADLRGLLRLAEYATLPSMDSDHMNGQAGYPDVTYASEPSGCRSREVACYWAGPGSKFTPLAGEWAEGLSAAVTKFPRHDHEPRRPGLWILCCSWIRKHECFGPAPGVVQGWFPPSWREPSALEVGQIAHGVWSSPVWPGPPVSAAASAK